jgi:predicted regulator of Ras-like GTPase activity (Roadblock/LC7/MglB family)
MSPDRVLAHLRETAHEVREAVVVDPSGRRLAGSRTLAGPAGELLRHAGDAAEIEVGTGRGTVFAVRGDHAAIAVVAQRSALSSVMRYDLRMAAAEVNPS